jgi:site-specific DNA-methyltransferase (adenine-specific)
VKGDKGREGGITPDGYVSHGGTAHDITAPATDAAKQWDGWGTALKPASEPIVVARKPLVNPALDVVSEVERQMRAQGAEEIVWR